MQYAATMEDEAENEDAEETMLRQKPQKKPEPAKEDTPVKMLPPVAAPASEQKPVEQKHVEQKPVEPRPEPKIEPKVAPNVEPTVQKAAATTHTPIMEEAGKTAEPTPATCAKECTDKCLAKGTTTVSGMIKCLKECKCDKPKTEHLLKEVRLSDERSFGKMEWGTFFVTFFILSTLAMNGLTVYKKWNYAKAYNRFYKIGGGMTALYQRLV